MTRIVHYCKKQFELPSEGLHDAELDEIKDIDATIDNRGEEKERVRFVWELLDLVNSSSHAFKVWQTFNLTLHPQSFLAKAIYDITGSEPGEEFDLDSLLHTKIQLVIKHNQGPDGRTYANVATILRPKTTAEEAEEKRVAAAAHKAKENAGRQRTHIVAASPPADKTDITDFDIPF
jgi:hypothetical protein